MGTMTQANGPSVPLSQSILPVVPSMVTSSQGLGIPPTASYVPLATFMPTQGPGIPPATTYIPPVTVTPMQGPGIPPTASYVPLATFMPMQGLGIPPATTYVPPVMVTPTQGPGVPPTASYVPLATFMPTQGPGIPPATSYVPSAMPSQGPSAFSVAVPLPQDPMLLPSGADDHGVPATSEPATRLWGAWKRRYEHPQKMTPGVGISAA